MYFERVLHVERVQPVEAVKVWVGPNVEVGHVFTNEWDEMMPAPPWWAFWRSRYRSAQTYRVIAKKGEMAVAVRAH